MKKSLLVVLVLLAGLSIAMMFVATPSALAQTATPSPTPAPVAAPAVWVPETMQFAETFTSTITGTVRSSAMVHPENGIGRFSVGTVITAVAYAQPNEGGFWLLVSNQYQWSPDEKWYEAKAFTPTLETSMLPRVLQTLSEDRKEVGRWLTWSDSEYRVDASGSYLVENQEQLQVSMIVREEDLEHLWFTCEPTSTVAGKVVTDTRLISVTTETKIDVEGDCIVWPSQPYSGVVTFTVNYRTGVFSATIPSDSTIPVEALHTGEGVSPWLIVFVAATAAGLVVLRKRKLATQRVRA